MGWHANQLSEVLCKSSGWQFRYLVKILLLQHTKVDFFAPYSSNISTLARGIMALLPS